MLTPEALLHVGLGSLVAAGRKQDFLPQITANDRRFTQMTNETVAVQASGPIGERVPLETMLPPRVGWRADVVSAIGLVAGRRDVDIRLRALHAPA
jgi:hypothetical protein